MPLSVGSLAPAFEVPATSGGFIRLADHIGQPVVLFFYPKDFSPLCTAEACSMRDAFPQYEQLGVTVYGISDGSVSSQQSFRALHHLPYHLLSDSDGTLRRAYGVLLPFGITRRVTYLLRPEGKHHVVQAVYENNFSGRAHTEAIQRELAALAAY